MRAGRIAARLVVVGTTGALWLLQPTAAAAQQPPPPPPPGAPPPSQPPPNFRPPPPSTPPPSLSPTTSAPVVTTPAPAPEEDDSTSPPVLPIALATIAIVGGGLALAWRRGGRPASPAPVPVVRPPSTIRASGPDVDALLEVSRRLTHAASTGDVDRALVRDAIGLVPARGAALVRMVNDELVIAHESHADLLVPDGVGEGLIRRVAETGQPIMQVSATEPAVRHLPAAVAAVPLVGAGRVEAVLVLVRNQTDPFTNLERESLVALAPVAAAALHSAREARSAKEDSLIDPLTQVGNRRRLDADLAGALATGTSTAFVIADLDKFKAVNDTHGHPAGDALLRGVVNVIQQTVRPGDSVYRFGGEEFCVLLRNTSIEAAVEVAERVRAAVAEGSYPAGTSEPLQATASFGVAAAVPGDDAPSLLGRADAALYAAKQGGRNRVVAG